MTGQQHGTRVARLELSLAWEGDPNDLIVMLTARSGGNVPIPVDRELVFFLEVSCWTPEGSLIDFDAVKRLPRPGEDEVRGRIVELRPGEELRRRIDLKHGFKSFEWDWNHSDPMSVRSAEVIRCVPEGVAVGSADVFYARPGWELPTYLLENDVEFRVAPDLAMNYGLPSDLYAGPIASSRKLFVTRR